MRFVLVHGTFSSNKTWDTFKTELLKAGHTTKPTYWPWSGANAQGGRMAAAERLAVTLAEEKAKAPDQPLFLVAHSHGGNVCRAAVAQAEPGTVQGIAFIATPHLSFTARPGRFEKLFLYSVLAYLVLGPLSLGLVATSTITTWLVGKTGGGMVAMVFVAGLIEAILLYLGYRFVVSDLYRERGMFMRIGQWMERQRKAAERRNCYKPREVAELNITTSSDEALVLLRVNQWGSRLYQSMLWAFFSVATIWFFVVSVLSAIIMLVMAVVTFGLLGDPLPPDKGLWDLAVEHDVPAIVLSFLGLPVCLAFMVTMVVYIYWLFYGARWNYGIGRVTDLLFLRIDVLRKFEGQDVEYVRIPFWRRLRTLLHFSVHRQPETVKAVLKWAERISKARRDLEPSVKV